MCLAYIKTKSLGGLQDSDLLNDLVIGALPWRCPNKQELSLHLSPLYSVGTEFIRDPICSTFNSWESFSPSYSPKPSCISTTLKKLYHSMRKLAPKLAPPEVGSHINFPMIRYDGETTRVYIPFYMADLALCKEKFGRFSEDLNKFADESEKVTVIYDLTRQDLQILLSMCCTIEEKNYWSSQGSHWQCCHMQWGPQCLPNRRECSPRPGPPVELPKWGSGSRM